MNAASPTDSLTASQKTIQFPGIFSLFLIVSLASVISYTRYYVFAPVSETHGHYWPGVLLWMACFYPWAILARIVFRLEKAFPVAVGVWHRNVVILSVSGIVISYAAFLLSILFTLAFGSLVRAPVSIHKPFWAIPLNELWVHWLLYLVVASITYVIRKLIEAQENERRNASLALEK